MPNRPAFFTPDGHTISDAWKQAYGFVVQDKQGRVVHFPQFGKPKPGLEDYTYVPNPKQLDFHESVAPNCIIEGSRGTGKSGCIRMDAHMRALSVPNYPYLIIRRTMPELKKSHLRFIHFEMKALGGDYHKTDAISYYPNGSQGFFSHCETEDDMMRLLSSEYAAIYFDEISTFTWSMITKIASCLRVPEGSDMMAVSRGGTNPIGVGAAEVRRYYIVKDITPEEDPDYNPEDFQAIHTTLEDNPHIDREQYIKRLSNLPDHIRRAWLDGEWVVEGAYFHDYKPQKKTEQGLVDWHCVSVLPVVHDRSTNTYGAPHQYPWIQVYRAFDWGFSPDPAVCLWIASLPDGRALVFKEYHWKSTPARQVALDIKRMSEGMRIVDTYCDPSIFFNSNATEHMSIGDIIESQGVPLTESVNDRAAAGYAIHEYLNTLVGPPGQELPKLQIFLEGCPMLARTLGEMRVDKNHPERIANGNDHWVISLAYYCMASVGTSKDHTTVSTPRWMRPNPNHRHLARLGNESVRVRR